jgi:GT2 family glycosyltransferase
MKVATIIVSFNGASWIRGALQSLRDSEHPSLSIVVDNASSDDTVAIVGNEFPETVLIESGGNLGFGLGNNLGIAHALHWGAELTFLLNQDAYVTPQAIGDMVIFLSQHPEYGIVSPLHCSPDLSRVDAQTQRGYLQCFAADYLSDACLGRIAPHYEIRGINAAAWGVRAEVWRRVGGFDPLYFMYGEDDDLIDRFAHHGLRTALLPAARIVHLRAKAPRTAQRWGQRVRSRSDRLRSQLLLDLKRPAGSWPGKVMRLFTTGVLSPTVELLNRHDLVELLAHWLATVRLLPELARIHRHAALCRTAGPHFLPEKTGNL